MFPAANFTALILTLLLITGLSVCATWIGLFKALMILESKKYPMQIILMALLCVPFVCSELLINNVYQYTKLQINAVTFDVQEG